MPTRLSADLEIIRVNSWAVNIPLTDDFTISQGSLSVAANVFVEVELKCGAVGYGECAPFTDITGEDQTGTLKALAPLGELVTGRCATAIRSMSRLLSEAEPEKPAARCGLETAILDALCRALGIPLWAYFGGAPPAPLETDITLPIMDRGQSLARADHWYRQGFRTLKMKVGRDLDTDLGTIAAIAGRFRDLSFVIDANQGFSESEALALVRSLVMAQVAVRMLEQPVARADYEALAKVRSESPFPICADESVASCSDVARLARAGAADIVNVKIMKCGVTEALDIALTARGCGFEIMFGGMMESRLAMGCSLAMAIGIGPVHTLDLDTPLLMSDDPVTGGYRYEGPLMHASTLPGLGCAPRSVYRDDD